MVTAKDDEYDKVQGLDIGDDDYVIKPFSAFELVVCVRATQCRAVPVEEQVKTTFICGDLTMHFTRQRVTLAGQEMELTAIESGLLSF
ncbi:MAG: response regulator transcription factor [Dehalococcoidia bacterium]|nr:response regulator transcription factor [Dehalococcoidia bacterium]